MNPSTHHNLRVTHPSLREYPFYLAGGVKLIKSTDIRDIRDAHRVFEAVRLHILPLIKRRLSPSERNSLQSGHVFVWEESDSEEGLVRWTEGKRWSQSKMRGDCLVYEEKVQVTEAEKRDKATRRQVGQDIFCI
ncbi:hypothetical protein MIND_00620800 [Mycena indigotica]|uniref:Gti1/Pac2 family-domain-containing protein n=1 Tax=Mycena indigotica TaxID=2126181 RepID=A0A8H6SQ24_9AGAR|nr:uncharacterized protein MIND_00620800 [Mycena indigotica]KAF7303905.1 hypothetical protein MIND_00620800 [Mycena indigotica]